LYLNLVKDKKKSQDIQAVGGCLALVQLLERRLGKATASIPACDQVTELNELVELETLYNTLAVLTNLTFHHDESRTGVSAIGGVEAVVKIMKTFPKCQMLQERACATLHNLAFCSIGKTNAIESDGIGAFLAAVSNHLSSEIVCQNACGALHNIVCGSNENIELIISVGAAAGKGSTKWPNNDNVQMHVRKLVDLIGSEMKAWASKK
jgi:hypothetical protein